MHWKTLLVLSAAALVLAACGGDDDDDSTPTPVPTATVSGSPGTVVTPTPGTGPTGTPGPALDSAQFEVVDSISYSTDTGLYFVGEVQNNSDQDAIITIGISLTDEAGTEVGSGGDRLQARPFTPPGEKMPFKMLIAGGPETWATETFAVTAREATDEEVARVYTDFVFDGASTSQTEQGIHVQGVLRNVGTLDMNPIKIMFIARDGDGRIIGAWGANPQGGLLAGAETVFAFPVLDVPAPPANFDLIAYAFRS